MPLSPDALQLLRPDGTIATGDHLQAYQAIADTLTDDQLQLMYRTMVVTRALDLEAGTLQRQGQMALWVPSVGQEACQVGSALATRPQDTIFPAYREHSIARLRGVTMVQIVKLMRGISHGGWDPKEHGNFRLYTLVLSAQTLHAAGYAMDSLKRSMRWDEEVYGREYDLDIYMIVAVDFFNMGAMENKGLNIFNTSCVLASQKTSTDLAFQRVEAVVAHEYFH